MGGSCGLLVTDGRIVMVIIEFLTLFGGFATLLALGSKSFVIG